MKKNQILIIGCLVLILPISCFLIFVGSYIYSFVGMLNIKDLQDINQGIDLIGTDFEINEYLEMYSGEKITEEMKYYLESEGLDTKIDLGTPDRYVYFEVDSEFYLLISYKLTGSMGGYEYRLFSLTDGSEIIPDSETYDHLGMLHTCHRSPKLKGNKLIFETTENNCGLEDYFEFKKLFGDYMEIAIVL